MSSIAQVDGSGTAVTIEVRVEPIRPVPFALECTDAVLVARGLLSLGEPQTRVRSCSS
jgi:hypothetical protein